VFRKDVRSRGGIQFGHFANKGTSALFGAKDFGFSKFIVCQHGRGGGGEPVWKRKSIFRDFVMTFLWTASYSRIKL